jgi:AsmA protein
MTHRGDDDLEGFRPRHDLSEEYAGAPVQGGMAPLNAQAGRQAHHLRKRSPLVTVALYMALGVVAVLVTGVIFLFIAAPTHLIRDEIIAIVKAETGRDLSVAGKTSFSFFPSLGIELGDVSLSPPPGMAGAPTMRVAALTVSVPIVPLLRRELAIDRLVLDKPEFDLRVDRHGRRSWDFAKLELIELANLALDDVRIVDGTLRYSDERSGVRETIDQINVKVALKSLTSPLSAAGDLRWKSETVRFDGHVGSLKAVLDGVATKLAMKVDARPVTANFRGTLRMGETALVDGRLGARSASVAKLAAWFGTTLPNVKGLGLLTLDGQLKTTGSTVALNNATIVLDGATAKGKISVDTKGIRPFVRTTLQISELDLNKYMVAGGSAARPPAKLKDESEKPAGPLRGYTQRAGGWSTEPIDVSGLGALDLEGRLTLGRLLYEKIKVGRSEIAIVLRNRQLKINFEEVHLYEGKGRGVLVLDARQSIPRLVARLRVNGVSARPLLRDAAGFDGIAGDGQLTLSLTGQGRNQQQIVSALNGTADLAFFNGALVGINIPAIIRSAQRFEFDGWSQSPSQKTDFSELSAIFKIVQGIARNQDLKMTSPLLRITGEGMVSLPAKTLDYVVKPKLVASLAGQGGQQDLAGIVVPVRVHGAWANPNFTPDLSGFLKGLKGGSIRSFLDGLIGRSGKGSGGDVDKDDVEKLLKKFLGR